MLVLVMAPSAMAALPSGLVAFWEGNGNTTESVNGLSATFTQGSYSTARTPAKRAFNLTGSTAVVVSDASQLHIPSYSISAWFYAKSGAPGVYSATSGYLVSKSKDTSGGLPGTELMEVYVYADGHIQAQPVSGMIVSTATEDYNVDAWNHIVMTFDNNSSPYEGRIYVNGVDVTFATTGAKENIQSSQIFPFNIGRRSDGSDPFNNRMQQVAIYDSALSSDEINAIRAAQEPTIIGISPSGGMPSVGTSVVISGSNLSSVTAVKFGATAAQSVSYDSNTQITALSPAGNVGTVDITVFTQGVGTSATSNADKFTYAKASQTITNMAFTPASLAVGATTTASASGGASGIRLQYSNNR